MWFMDLHLCRMIDDRWFYVARFLTCRATDAHTGAYFPFQMRFMDLHLCRMIDDRWFHVARFLTCHMFDAHTGAYYSSRWDLRILVGLCTYPYLRDVCRDNDLFTIFMMIPQRSLSRVAQSDLHFSSLKCHHAFLLGDALLIYLSDSVIDMDDLDRAFDGRWLEPIWFFDLSHFRCHTRVYSPFRLRFVDSPTDLHDHPRFWDTHRIDDAISLCPDTLRSLSGVFQPDSRFLI